MTISDRIENLVGSYPYGTNLEQILQEAARLIIAELPEASLLSFAVEETDDGTTGVDVTNKRIVKVHKGGYPARRVDETMDERLTNVSDPTPVYYVAQNTAYVKPDGGKVVTVSFPTIRRNMLTVTGWPTMLVDLVVDRAATMILDLMMVDIREGYGTSVTLPTVPTAPAAPSFSATDATAVAPSAVTVAALPTAPTYTEPTLGDEGAVPSAGTLTISASAPTPPTADAIAAVDATAASVAATTVGALGTAPTYTAPSFGGDIGSITTAIPAAIDLESEIDGVTPLAPPDAPSAPSLSSAGQASVTVDFAGITAPVYSATSSGIDYTNWETYLTNEDPEIMGEIIRKLGNELGEFQGNLQDARNAFDDTVEEYRALVNKAIEDARIGAQEAANELRQTDEMALAQYGQTLALYDKQIAKYQLEVQAQIQQQESAIARAVNGLATAQRLWVEKYGADLRGAADELQKDVVAYQQDAAHKIEQARISLQEALTDAQQSTDVSVRNEAATLQAAIASYDAKLNLFQANIALYRANVEKEVTAYTADLDRAIQIYSSEGGVKVQRYSSLLQNARAKFEKDLAVYRATLERDRLVAEIARQEAAQTAQQATDVALQNKARQLEKEVSDYQAQLGKYQAEISSYNTQVQAQLSNQGVVTESTVAKLRMFAEDRNRAYQRYTAVYQAFVRAFYPRHSYIIQQHAI